MSWGEELWDRFDDVVNVVNHGTRELESFYKHFLKERSKIEKEYAHELRKLIKKYSAKANKNNGDDESTQNKGFRYYHRRHLILHQSKR